MSVRATMRLAKPDATEATLTITATIGEFRDFVQAIQGDKYPVWKFRGAVEDVVAHADAWFTATRTKEAL